MKQIIFEEVLQEISTYYTWCFLFSCFYLVYHWNGPPIKYLKVFSITVLRYFASLRCIGHSMGWWQILYLGLKEVKTKHPSLKNIIWYMHVGHTMEINSLGIKELHQFFVQWYKTKLLNWDINLRFLIKNPDCCPRYC